MKVLIVMGTMGMGGAEKSLIALFKHLTPQMMIDNELEIDFLVPDIYGELISEIPDYIHVLKAPYIFCTYALPCEMAKKVLKSRIIVPLLKAIFKINSKIKKSHLSNNEEYWNSNSIFIPKLQKKYDVSLAYMNGTATYYVIEKLNASKKIVWIHSEYEKLNYTDDFQRKFYEKADAIVTISQKCVDSFVQHFPELRNKVVILENISSFADIHAKANAFYPNEYQGERKKIISVGRLNQEKGFDIGIEAMEILKKEDIKFDWYILGEGAERERLQMKINKLDLQDCIHLLGIRKNPYPYIKNADLFFQPSRYEGKSISLDEAKILNKAIVVANYGTVHDSINNDFDGKICDLNPEHLAAGLVELIINKQMRKKFEKNLKVTVKGNEKEVEKYISLICGEEI